jgi:tetratricopeptide (TPR) repeat protein
VYSYGNFLQEQGREDEALRQYEQVASLLRQYPALAPYVEADFHIWYGAALEAKGREDAAIAEYRSALVQRPGWLVPLRNIAQTLMHMNRTEEAITAYRQTLAADPMFNIGYVNLALCLSRVQKHDEAVATLATFTRTVPETAENAYYRGFIAQHLNLIEQARQAYRRALDLDASRADAQRALASLGRSGESTSGVR